MGRISASISGSADGMASSLDIAAAGGFRGWNAPLDTVLGVGCFTAT
jgi:hypothetical protein